MGYYPDTRKKPPGFLKGHKPIRSKQRRWIVEARELRIEKLKQKGKEKMKQSTLDALNQYVNTHTPTGDFLDSVLTNNLLGSVIRADEENRRDLPEIVSYCYNHIPSVCWGSPAKVKAWLEGGKNEISKNSYQI